MTTPPANSPYAPEDARITTTSLEFLHTPEGTKLLASIAAVLATRAEPTVADVASFRKHFPADVVHAAFAVARLQSKATGPHGKFPTLHFLWSVPEALEQATDAGVARHKAARFAHAGITHIFDFCAGIGGDTLALANIAPITAIDLSPIRTLCLNWNLENAHPKFPVTIRTEDLRQTLPTIPPDAAAFHIDPSRRSEGKRSPRYEDLIPGPDVLHSIIQRFTHNGGEGGAIKLSSAVDFDSLPPGHLELISHNRTVVQAVLWVGKLTTTFGDATTLTRTASILKNHKTLFTFTAAPRRIPFLDESPLSASVLPTTLYELDGAFTRADLAAPLAESLQLSPLTPDGGYLVGKNAGSLDHPALTAFTILSVVPYSEQRVADALQQAGGVAGPIEVKTRGGLPNIDTDRLQKIWTKSAPLSRSVFLFRHAGDVVAVIAQRLSDKETRGQDDKEKP